MNKNIKDEQRFLSHPNAKVTEKSLKQKVWMLFNMYLHNAT